MGDCRPAVSGDLPGLKVPTDMRILVATSHRSVVGGVETYLRDVLPALVERGHMVGLLHEQPAMETWPAVNEGTPAMPVWGCPERERSALLRDIGTWRPDVIYLQGLGDPDLEKALVDHYPTVLFAHNYHGTCASGTKRYAMPWLQPCRRILGVGCLGLYYPRRCGGLSPRTMVRSYRRQRQHQKLLACYRRILVASRHMHEEYRRHGVSEERLRLLPLFPPKQVPDPAPPPVRPPNGRVLLVGRLTDVKGGRLLVEALGPASRALARSLTLVVAGDGPERAAMEALANSLRVRAEFLGWVSAVRRTALMREADVLVIPSVWPEPFGLVGVEAGCVGLPTVAFAVGGIPDWLLAGETGELAPGDRPDPASLAEALVRALADRVRLARMREGAWRMSQRFSLATHVKGLEAVLEQAAHA
jgi:glycosyltransferase involved in cell wall biosynthesis